MRIKIVNQKQVVVIEKFGKFQKLGESGVNILRFGEKIVASVDLRTQIVKSEKKDLITLDSVILETDAVIYFKIVDVMKAVYNVQNYKQAMVLLVETAMRNEVAKMKMEEALSKKDELNASLAQSIDEATGEWGLKVERVEILDMKPTKKMAEAMEKERVAELEKKALLTEVQGQYDKEVKESQGKKQARVLNAEAEKDEAVQKAQAINTIAQAEANRITTIAQAKAEELRLMGTVEAENAQKMLTALKESGADDKVISLKYIEAMNTMAKGENKVFFPYNENIGLSQVGVLSEVSEPNKDKEDVTADAEHSEQVKEEIVEVKKPEPAKKVAAVEKTSELAKEVGGNVKDMMAKGIGVVKGLKK